MYLSFAEYQSMGGTLTQTTFNDFEFEAETVVDWYTFGRLKKFNPSDYPEALKKCMYHIIKLIENQAVLNGMATASTSSASDAGVMTTIASQSNDGVSVSYNVLSAKDLLDSNTKSVEQTIRRYLSYVVDSLGRKVLYRGIYDDE